MSLIAILPTYNEAENIAAIVSELRALPQDPTVLVVDDNSPDGTAGIVRGLAAEDPKVHLLLRLHDRGRGWAGIEAFARALAMGADHIVELDADHSHPPRFIPAMLERAREADIVLGSRYVSGGRDQDRAVVRRIVSALARRYLALVLGVRLADPTSGYRLFTRAAVERVLPHLRARDPFIVTEVIFFARRAGLRLAEVPIEFMERRAGQSKLDAGTLVKYLFRVIGLRLFR